MYPPTPWILDPLAGIHPAIDNIGRLGVWHAGCADHMPQPSTTGAWGPGGVGRGARGGLQLHRKYCRWRADCAPCHPLGNARMPLREDEGMRACRASVCCVIDGNGIQLCCARTCVSSRSTERAWRAWRRDRPHRWGPACKVFYGAEVVSGVAYAWVFPEAPVLPPGPSLKGIPERPRYSSRNRMAHVARR